MNAIKSYLKKYPEVNPQFSLYTLSPNDLGAFSRHDKRYQKDYTNPAYQFHWLDHVLAMPDLTGAGVKILIRIIRDQRDGYCYRSIANLAAACNCKPRTVNATLAKLRADETIRVYARYRKGGRGRTSSRIYVNWEHLRWANCPRRDNATQMSAVEHTSADSMNAVSAQDSLQENSRKLATAVSMTVEEQPALTETAEEKTQAENGEKPEETPAPVNPETSKQVLGALLELGVPPVVAISDAGRAPNEALAVLAVVYGILARGGIRNPAGLARDALRKPDKYLSTRARHSSGRVVNQHGHAVFLRPAPDDGVARGRPCWICGQPLDPLMPAIEGAHFDCDESRRG